MSDKPVKERKLTGKQELFCQIYAKCLDASQAADEAGYSKHSRGTLGYQLLQIPIITKRIKTLREGAVEKVHIETSMILSELYKIATVDIGDAFNDDGSLRPIKEMPKALRQAISGIDTYKDFTEGVEIGETKKIKTWDKIKALELLGKYKGMWIEKTQSTNVNINVDIDEESETFKKIKQQLTENEPNDMVDVTPIMLSANEGEDDERGD